MIFLNHNIVNSFENKILFLINDEVITTIDVLNETNYLKALNKDLLNIEKDKIYEIAKNILIQENIKKKEILKEGRELNIEEKYIDEIIESIYKNRNFDNIEAFINYLNIFNLEIEYIKDKIKTDLSWNNLIIAKYADKIRIDVDEIKKKLNLNYLNESKDYFLSEIIFSVPTNSNLEEQTNLIKNDITKKGFKNAALIHSISNSVTKNGGEIGWVNENSLNLEIKNILNDMKIDEFTNPITIPGGFLILKIGNIRIVENKDFDFQKKLDETIRIKQNEQLNNYSNIYFRKVKREYIINEK